MISAGDFRNGITFEMDGNVVQVPLLSAPSIRMSSLVQW